MEGKQKVSLTFALYRGDALVRRETVTQDIVKVGKDAKSQLRIDDDLASRMHAVIEVVSPDDITLIDLGNEPGTMVNGVRVNKCKISAGDQLQIGGTRVVLERAERVVVAVAPSAQANPFGGAVAASANPFGAGSANPFAGGDAGDPFGLNNPFAPAPASDEVPVDAPEGSYTYTLMKSTAEVPADEVEDARASSVEVMILWDTTVLHVQHLTPPRSFYVGEEQGKSFTCDYFIPAEKLGTTRAPIVLADRGGSVSLVLPPRATGTIEIAGQPKRTVQQVIEQGLAQPCAELSGASQIALSPGSKARVEVGGLVFQISAGNAGRVVAGHFQLDSQGLLYAGVSLAVHAGLLAAMAFFMPPLGATDEDGISADQQYMMQQYLQAAAEKELQEKETEQLAENTADKKEGGSGARAVGEEGSAGDPNTHATGHKFGVKGPKENPDPHIARLEALRDAASFGAIGLLNAGAGGDPGAPTAPWGRDDSLGNDPMSAPGNMWGTDIGASYGAGGLGLSGIGEGGGGHGEGIGLGALGTIGHGNGLGEGDGNGNGRGHGHIGGAHQARPPSVHIGATQVSGRLPSEVIQRIVRQNFGRFRLCYENGLRNNPSLGGRVGVRFVIGRDGGVSNVANGGSDLPDGNVVSCVVRAFYGLSFPQPEGGIVTVTYPIVFTPGG
jgi:pSer/pThr/pTyr-binding forkhead associated (FHA) protein